MPFLVIEDIFRKTSLLNKDTLNFEGSSIAANKSTCENKGKEGTIGSRNINQQQYTAIPNTQNGENK
jgi:hypothetical protein